MLQILGITAPIFILIGIGYLSARGRLVSPEQVLGLGKFVITFALPALVIRALLEKPLDEVFDATYLLAYGIGSQLMFWGGFLFARLVRRDSLSGSALSGLGMSVSNSGFVGYPIVAMVLGSPAAVALALGMMVENLLMIPLALAIAELGRQNGGGLRAALLDTFMRLLRNPVIIAISVGLTLALLGVRLPAVPAKVVEMLAMASAPVALFVIGASLNGLRAGGLVKDVAQLSIGKLVLHPLAVLLCFQLLPPVDPVLRVAGVLFACSPMMSIYPILGQRYGLEGRCAAALVVCTVLAFVSISLFIGLLT
ncbi:AEC family transporter [Metapseudomonas lalkuanensis]|uniref:AEC family transporter n=1 Tax=Metapseudomonas lalkuanensis TaxID=2604832 RepID=A0A5J6QJG6_9GAMM|nr:AEC family transporter [Pseudomonas lalkuanensis]QEY62868.1 AEC family transporter [Pseudomonas lalkuanensis]UCO95906.1 AEC family transporter [Pseudomonas lalkuanensis]